MKDKTRFTGLILLIAGLLWGCGPSEQEIQRREQARQDSLEQVRQDSLDRLRRQRQDSIAQAKTDSMEMETQASTNVSFTANGRFSVQVESWRSQQKAQSRAEAWKERGFDQATVVQHGDESTGDVWFRVRLGNLQNREAAQQAQETLQEEYQAQSWIASN